MNIAIIVGSLRKDSYNMQLARSIQERYADMHQIEIVSIKNLPYYDQDTEMNPDESVITFKKKVSETDGVIIITPEYNWSIPGVLKNALDWLSRVDKVLVDKPVLPIGLSAGILGGIRAQLHLREVLASPGIQANVLPPAQNEIVINQAPAKFDPEVGKLNDKGTLEFLDAVMERFASLISKTNK